MILIYSLIVSLNILMTKCDQTCDCKEIHLLKEMVQNEILERSVLKEMVQNDILERNALMDIVQKEIFERKIETSKLNAKVRRIEATKRSLPASVLGPETGLADRIEKMDAKFLDLDVKLNNILNEKAVVKRNWANTVKKGVMIEKKERIDFISDTKSQMTSVKETVANFKAETIKLIEQCVANLTESQDDFRQDFNTKLHEMEIQTDLEIKSVSSDLTNVKQDLLDAHTNITESQDDFRQIFNTKLHEIEIQTDLEIKSVSSDLKNVKQDLLEAHTKVSKLDDALITNKKDGGWSQWGIWSTCTVSCGSGIRERTRTCTNPSPSVFGRHCESNSIMTGSCGNNRCTAQKVAFTAWGIEAGQGYAVVTFPNVVYNYGSGYSSTTGKFTCVIPGIYHFVVTLSIKSPEKNKYISCSVCVNTECPLHIYVYKDLDSELTFPSTAAGTFHLNKGETVYVGHCDGYKNIYNLKSTIFTGFLVAAD